MVFKTNSEDKSFSVGNRPHSSREVIFVPAIAWNRVEHEHKEEDFFLWKLSKKKILHPTITQTSMKIKAWEDFLSEWGLLGHVGSFLYLHLSLAVGPLPLSLKAAQTVPFVNILKPPEK